MKPTSRKGPLNCKSPFDFAPYEQKRLPVKLDARRGNSRSLHFATPDFLWNLVASASFMRLSLLKGAHAALSSAAWQEIRVGMTKGRLACPLRSVASGGNRWSLHSASLRSG